METHRLVLPGDLNQFGYLFGGKLLGWIDEASWIAASLDFPNCRFVTVGLDEVAFRHSVREGTILAIKSSLLRQGKTSVTYLVEVFDGRIGEGQLIFSTRATFVNLSENGHKTTIPSHS